MRLLQRTHEPNARYFFDGKRIDNQCFRNLLHLAVQNNIEPTEVQDDNSLTSTMWDITHLPSEQIKKAIFNHAKYQAII